MTFEIRVDYGLITGIFAGLILFGIGFNALTDWMERKGYMEGITSLMVALGVAFTIAPFAFISLPFALLIAGGFVCTGGPMIVGSISRYLKRRDEAIQNIARLYDDDETSRMARKR